LIIVSVPNPSLRLHLSRSKLILYTIIVIHLTVSLRATYQNKTGMTTLFCWVISTMSCKFRQVDASSINLKFKIFWCRSEIMRILGRSAWHWKSDFLSSTIALLCNWLRMQLSRNALV